MANKKISALTAKTTLDTTDNFVIAESTSDNKKIARNDVTKYIGTKIINEGAIADTYILQYDLATDKLVYVALPSAGAWTTAAGETTLNTDSKVRIDLTTTASTASGLSVYDSVATKVFDILDTGHILVNDKIEILSNTSTSKIEIGNNVTASGTQSIAIGTQTATASGLQGIAIGYSAQSTGDRSVSIGFRTKAGAASIAIGKDAGYSSTSSQSTLIGNDAGSLGINTHAVVIGNSEQRTHTRTESVMVGSLGHRTATPTDFTGSVLIGYDVAGDRAGTNTYNTFIGHNTGGAGGGGGTSAAITNSIFIGKDAGFYETSSNTLLITNQQFTTEATHRAGALFYGVMSATTAIQTLQINAATTINNTQTINLLTTVSATDSFIINDSVATKVFSIKDDGDGYFLGDVGIGTTTPNQLLELSAAVDPTIRINNTDTSVLVDQTIGGLEVYANDATTGGTGVAGYIKSIATNAGVQTRMEFGVRTGTGGAAATNMTIKHTGTINTPNLSTYADEAAAVTGGLATGDIYRTNTGELRIKL